MTSCNHGVVLTPNGGTHRPDPGLDQQLKDLFADQDAVQQVMQTDIHQQTCHADVDVCRQSTSDLSLMPDAVPESKEIYRDDGISGNVPFRPPEPVHGPRISLKEFAAKHGPPQKRLDSVIGQGLSPAIATMTSRSAEFFQFDEIHGISKLMDDLVHQGARWDWISREWVSNHYRWVVWLLASLDRTFYGSIPVATTYERVLRKLLLRYDREIVQSKRSAIKLILEQDRASSSYLILCIAGIDTVNERLELTDGWYSVFADLDPGLQDGLRKGKLVEGLKLRIFGASLSGVLSPCTPLENNAAKTRLRLSVNSTRRALWHSRLGFQKKLPFLVSLGSLAINGGVVPRVQVRVVQTLPRLFVERVARVDLDTGKRYDQRIVRNQLGESRANAQHRRLVSAVTSCLRDEIASYSPSTPGFLSRLARCSLAGVDRDTIDWIRFEITDSDMQFNQVESFLQNTVCSRSIRVHHRFQVSDGHVVRGRPGRWASRAYLLEVFDNEFAADLQVDDFVTVHSIANVVKKSGNILVLKANNRTKYSSKRQRDRRARLPDDTSNALRSMKGVSVAAITRESIMLCSPLSSEILLVRLDDKGHWALPALSPGQAVDVRNVVYDRADQRMGLQVCDMLDVGEISVSPVAGTGGSRNPEYDLQALRASQILSPSSCVHRVQFEAEFPDPKLASLSCILRGQLMAHDLDLLNHAFASIEINNGVTAKRLVIPVSCVRQEFDSTGLGDVPIQTMLRRLLDHQRVSVCCSAFSPMQSAYVVEMVRRIPASADISRLLQADAR
ncbi:unnamed protein product (mitochondrion) [Plasmodiophora brassicae]|uniref:BRCA2 OB1 domain-containing protein n=1 Tax=Plasmodiophora brassicae TaxID=37360 RepID=A0A3P3Y574_PLABS|nr:unnamed protein product [Plasmodiophora brassicae]